MLKFIRKYQMLILVVGGSLLMVVFLLEPVLSRLAPSPLKAKVASLENGTVFTRGDIIRAQESVTMLARTNSRALAPVEQFGLGLSTESNRTAALHWLMLADMAKQAGLVGEYGDGLAWIDLLSLQEAQIAAQRELFQGQLAPTDYQSRILELQPFIADGIQRNANAVARSMNGRVEDVYYALAEARGMFRMINMTLSTPSFSDARAIDATRDMYDAVAVNAVVIDPSLIEDTLETPSDEELGLFFDTYSNQEATENEFGIGYMMPTRIKLGWIALNKQSFVDAIRIDRVEIQKIWKRGQDDGSITGDFAAERAGIERQYRDDQATSLMIEADRLIRAQVLAKTNNLSKVDGRTQLPEDWASQAPDLVQIADSVTTRLNEQFGVSMPTIEVTLIGDRWLAPGDIADLGAVGTSTYRVGSNQIRLAQLPLFFAADYEGNIPLDVQVQLPIVEQAATDDAGNRYYAMVLDVRDAGPAEGISDVGRERVVQDYKQLKAYELLEARSEELATLARESGDLAPVVDEIMAMTNNPEATRPGVLRQILVRKDTIDPGVIANNVDFRLNNELFRNAVLAAAQDLDPLLNPETLEQSPIVVAEGLPQSKSFAFSVLIAPRPLTQEQFRTNAVVSMRRASSTELRDAGFFEANPFSYEALSERYGLTILQEDDDS
jgi:hypothetical protein